MFLFRKIRCHIKEHLFLYFILLAVVLAGFIAGCFYANLISSADFFQAGEQAEQFIKEAKARELSFPLMFFEELSAYLLIALFSFFLFGFIPSVFFVFKWGFSSGFFLTFLVKYFAMKGFFLGGFFLLLSIALFLPALLLISEKSLSTSRFLLLCAIHKAPPRRTLLEEITGIVLVFLVTALIVLLGVTLKFLLISPLCNYLFL